MKRRHPRRTTVALLAAAGMLTGALFSLTASGSAAAATPTAGLGTVRTGGTPLNMRSAPSSAGALVGTVPNGRQVAIVCRVAGTVVAGTVRTTNVWDRLTNNSYVSDGYILRTGLAIPLCSTAVTVTPPPTAGAWMLPVNARLVSGFRTATRPGHDGVDLGAARNTPIHATAAGTVIRVVCNVSTNNCDVDGNRTLSGCGWYAEIQHAGGIVTRYCHMVRRPLVNVGQVVAKGTIIGYVGTSGSSSGPHLHFEVHSAAPATHANAYSPIVFMRARGLIIS